MLATMQRMLHKLTRSRRAPAQAKVIARLAACAGDTFGLRQCSNWLTAPAAAPQLPSFPTRNWEAPLPLSTKVVKAGRPELLAVKEALLDTRRPTSAAAVQQRKTFLSDPSASPLFGGDPIIARRAATQLQRSVAAHPEP